MEEAKFEKHFDRLEKGIAHVTELIDKLANVCAHEFAAIAERFAQVDEHFAGVDKRLADIDANIEAFAHRVDFEPEERHKLAERVFQLERR